MKSRAAISLFAAAGAALALAAPAHAAPTGTLLSSSQQPSRVAAWKGDIVFSAYDPATQRFSLTRSEDGAPARALPVAPSARAFDVALGTNATGSTYAVYSRCDGGCDLYRLRLDGGAETRLTAISSPTADERDPTMFDGRIAFVRAERGGDTIRIAPSGTRGPTTLLVKGGRLSHPVLGPSTLAYLATTGPQNALRDSLRVVSTHGGAARTVAAEPAAAAPFTRLTGPTLTDSARSFVWAQTGTAAGRDDVGLFQYRIAGRRVVRGSIVDANWASTAWAGGPLGLATASDLYGGCYAGTAESIDETNCFVTYTGPVSFG